MTDDKLTYMANQIATFFRSKPEAEAVAGVADHINQFWEPRMRAKLLAELAEGGEGLSPLVKAAAPAIRPARPAVERTR